MKNNELFIKIYLITLSILFSIFHGFKLITELHVLDITFMLWISALISLLIYGILLQMEAQKKRNSK
ncbi:MAG: hypothetical protein ACFFA8_13550 [Promethearchaeota archaeon]